LRRALGDAIKSIEEEHMGISLKNVIADIERPFKAVKSEAEKLFGKVKAAREALEELAEHAELQVTDEALKLALPTEAAIEAAVNNLKAEEAKLKVK
jgi:hypothetical protein